MPTTPLPPYDPTDPTPPWGDTPCTPHDDEWHRRLDWFMAQPSEGWWWLSFVDSRRPEGERNLGVCIVPGGNIVQAGQNAWALGVQPRRRVRRLGHLRRVHRGAAAAPVRDLPTVDGRTAREDQRARSSGGVPAVSRCRFCGQLTGHWAGCPGATCATCEGIGAVRRRDDLYARPCPDCRMVADSESTSGLP